MLPVPTFPSYPAIGPTPYGNFGPTQVSSQIDGAMQRVTGIDYRNPNNRMFVTTVQIDMMNLPTLPERLEAHLQQALIFHLKDAAERVIATAQQSLRPGHGVRTGLLRRSLEYALATHLLATGVYYDLFSEEAYYWRWVEFGHWIAGTNRFWPGYHFLETALRVHESKIRASVREAWADVVIKLGAEARAADPRGAGL